MSKLPITKIIITLPTTTVASDIWKLFDYIIHKMEEIDPASGMPKVDAMGRKKFRAGCLKAPDGTLYDVFTKWVTILIPNFVTATAEVLKQSAKSKEDLEEIARRVVEEIEGSNRVEAELAAKVEAARQHQAEVLKRARAAKKHPPKITEGETTPPGSGEGEDAPKPPMRRRRAKRARVRKVVGDGE